MSSIELMEKANTTEDDVKISIWKELSRYYEDSSFDIVARVEHYSERIEAFDSANYIIDVLLHRKKRINKNDYYLIRVLLKKSSDIRWTCKNLVIRAIKRPINKFAKRMRLDDFWITILINTRYKSVGYTKTTIKSWKKIVADDNWKNPYVARKIRKWAHNKGFLIKRIEQYGLDDTNYKRYISDRDYIYLNPVNCSYKKWIEDIPSISRLFSRFEYSTPKLYFHCIIRDGKTLFLPQGNFVDVFDGNDVWEIIDLIKKEKVLHFRPARCRTDYRSYIISYRDSRFWIADKERSEEEIRNILSTRKIDYVIQEYVEMNEVGISDSVELIRLTIINDNVQPFISDLYARVNSYTYIQGNPATGIFTDGQYISNWNQLKEKIVRICKYIPQLEYYALHLKVRDGEGVIVGMDPIPVILKEGMISAKTNDFLLQKLNMRIKKRPFYINFKGRITKVIKAKFVRPGYRDFMLKEYTDGIIKDFLRFRGTSLKQKVWAYKRGFYSYRIGQYNLNDLNWNGILSDRDYHWLCPINNNYQKLIDDKMTFRYMFDDYKKYIPRYYYQIIQCGGTNKIIRLSDCDKRFGEDYNGVMELLHAEKELAVKQSSGEHGDGFFKLSYVDGLYYVNNEIASREEIIIRLKGLRRFYNITEYLHMHDELRDIYPFSVNTIRIMVINEDGLNPVIANAYMRIGTGSTKLTDNVGYGGLFAKVDVESGYYHDAERLNNHIIIPCPNHPDTNALIEGYVPLWEEAKKIVYNIARYINPLEYLGFDLAITDSGIKILEINKFQDLHRCSGYGDYIQGYFTRKIQQKKKRYRLEN